MYSYEDYGYDKKLLLLSAALNIFFIGILLGAGYYYSMWSDVSPAQNIAQSAMTSDPLLKLPEARRQVLKTGLDSIQKTLTDARTENSKLKKEAMQLLTADSFKEKAYIDFNKHLYEQAIQMRLRAIQAIADLAAKATPAEREIIAEELVKISPSFGQLPKEGRGPSLQAP